jgi:glycosyltransferase involved in cell wall biosynthesis
MDSPRVLIVSCSHSGPPTQPRPQRARELGRHLGAAGCAVDQIVLLDQPVHSSDQRKIASLREGCKRLDVIESSALERWWGKALALLPGRGFVDGRDCSRGLLTRLRRLGAGERYDGVILISSRLLPAASFFRDTSSVFLDFRDIVSSVERSSRRMGREDAIAPDRALTAEAIVSAGARGVVVRCDEDRRQLESIDSGARILVIPPLADPVLAVPHRPVRPPRLLFVGSETVENLDAVRWLRRRVMPRVRRLVPTCRLRIVGEAGRHIEPGDDVDRVGWVDDLAGEYRAASAVVLPMRLGGRLRRRLVEAISFGKAVAVSEEAAYGIELRHREDGVVASSEEALAQGLVDVLSEDLVRERFEARSREIARQRFEPLAALRPMVEMMGEGAPKTATETAPGSSSSPGR